MLHSQLQSDLRQAIKDGDASRVSTLRLILAAVRDGEVGRGGQIEDEEILELLSCMRDQCAESIAASEREGEGEQLERKRREREIIEGYLPPPMAESEVIRAVEDAIEAADAHSIRDIGRTMQRLRETCTAPHDLARASREARRRLVS